MDMFFLFLFIHAKHLSIILISTFSLLASIRNFVYLVKMSTAFMNWFWNERFWLPRNVTWADLRNTDGAVYAQASDLWIAFPYAVFLYCFRLLIERYDIKQNNFFVVFMYIMLDQPCHLFQL